MIDLSNGHTNGNGNGNGHQKAFVLERPKTAEEIAQESTRKIAPEIRRAVRSMKIPAAAKFLFDAILDDTFMFDFGGDGRGTLLASIHDLAIRYRHDKDSIVKWAGILRDKEVLWFHKCWPWFEWRVTAICPAPQSKASSIQKIKARASAKRTQSKAESIGNLFFRLRRVIPLLFPRKSEERSRTYPLQKRKVSEVIGEPFGGSLRHLPPLNRGHLRRMPPIGSELTGDTSPVDAPIEPEGDSESGAVLPLQFPL